MTQVKEKVNLKLVDIRRAIVRVPYSEMPLQLECPNPDHKDDTASLRVYRSHIHCYGCGFDIPRRMDALAHLLGCTVREAIARAGEFLQLAEEKRMVPAKDLGPMSPSICRFYEDMLWGMRRSRVSWLLARGLTEATIRKFRLGHDGTRFTIPFFDAKGNLLTIRYRQDPLYVPAEDMEMDERDRKREAPSKYAGTTGRNGQFLYPEWLIPNALDFLVVCEGELDAVRLWQDGIPAVAQTNGAPSLPKILDLLEPYTFIDTLYIAADQDDAGEKAAQVIMQSTSRFKRIRLSWPRSVAKDVTDLLKVKVNEQLFYRQLNAA